MQWDNAPVYRRRRRLVGGLAALTTVGLVWSGAELTGALSGNGPADGSADEVAAAPAAQGSASVDPTPVNHVRTGKASTITIAFGGDTLAHGEAKRVLEDGLGSIGTTLAAADLAMVNLETAVATDQSGLMPQPKPYTFITGPKILTVLKDAGVDVVTAANNHAMDFGAEGMNRMLEVKASSPIPIVGIGKDDTEAWAPWTTEVKGRKVVIFGATDVLESTLDWKAGPGKPGVAKVKDDDGYAKLLDAVRAARTASPDDAIIVYLHSGIELNRCPTTRQKQTATDLAIAGADVVIGSHAHQLQATTTSGNTFVEYGMGNFVFEAHKVDTRTTGVLRVTIPGGQGAPTASFEPAEITDGIPVPKAGAARDTAIANWEKLGAGCS